MTHIQFMDRIGVWHTIMTIKETDDINIMANMKGAKRNYPKNRIRAIDDKGRLIDILPDEYQPRRL